MDINTLVKTVKEYADKVNSEVPSAAGDSDAQIAVIVDAKDRIYSAVTSVVIKEGAVSKLSADYLKAESGGDGYIFSFCSALTLRMITAAWLYRTAKLH